MRVSIFTTSSDNASDFSARLRFWSMRTFSFSIDLIMMGVVALRQIFQGFYLLFVMNLPTQHSQLNVMMTIKKKIEQKAQLQCQPDAVR